MNAVVSGILRSKPRILLVPAFAVLTLLVPTPKAWAQG